MNWRSSKMNAVILFVLPMIVALALAQRQQFLSVDQVCGPSNDNTTRICMRSNECNPEHKDSAPSCGFYGGIDLICCPGAPKLVYNSLVSLRYLKQPYLDDNIYRCTAVIATNGLLITSTNCVSDDASSNPNSALFGVSNPSASAWNHMEIEVKEPIVNHNKGYAVLRLAEPIDKANLSVHVEKANFCSRTIDSQDKLYAVGYAQHNGINCGLFKTQLRLVDFNECRNVHNEFEMLNISKRTHLCLRPVQNSRTNLSGPNNCQRCLIASSSVLHVEQANGSVCVLGIATPQWQIAFKAKGHYTTWAL